MGCRSISYMAAVEKLGGIVQLAELLYITVVIFC